MGGRNKKGRQSVRLGACALLLLCLAAWLGLRAAPAEVPADSAVELTLPPERTVPAQREKLAALTFDDGPSPVTTPELLDGLAERGVHATFFLIGSQAEANGDIVQRMDEAGHQIGLHTYDHVCMADLSDAGVREQMEKSRAVLSTLLGREDFWLRPPYGIIDDAAAARVDVPMILWSVDPEDWKDRNEERVVEQVLSEAEDGDIILMHDIFPQSVSAALRIADGLRERGFRLVTVEELFAARGVEPEAGQRYTSAPG